MHGARFTQYVAVPLVSSLQQLDHRGTSLVGLACRADDRFSEQSDDPHKRARGNLVSVRAETIWQSTETDTEAHRNSTETPQPAPNFFGVASKCIEMTEVYNEDFRWLDHF